MQELYEKARTIIKNDAYMKFYNEKELLYLETDASGVGLGAGVLQARHSLQLSQYEAPDKTAGTSIVQKQDTAT